MSLYLFDVFMYSIRSFSLFLAWFCLFFILTITHTHRLLRDKNEMNDHDFKSAHTDEKLGKIAKQINYIEYIKSTHTLEVLSTNVTNSQIHTTTSNDFPRLK